MGSAQVPTTLTVLDMPLPGTKQAPKRFSGDYRYVQDFIEHYERLLHRCNVTDDAEQCTAIRQYCSQRVKETIEGMPDYITPNWSSLKATILKFYDAERNEQRYTERDLISFLRITRDQPVSSVNKFRTYQRNFYRIAGWLQGKNKITEIQMKRYFWRGLPKKVRHQVEVQILMAHPRHDMTQPFEIEHIVSAIDRLFMRTRFDVDDSDNEIDLDWPESQTDSDDESEKESDDDSKHRSISKKKKKSRNKFSARDPDDPTEEKGRKPVSADRTKKILKDLEKEGVEAQKQDEMESLIKQLGQMSLDDPKYGILYYRAIVIDPRLEKIIHPPLISSGFRTASATQNMQNVQNTSNIQYAPRTGPRPPFECYGCGGKDHGMNNCPELNELMNQGIIKRGADNKYILADGSRIFRNPGENIAQAVKRHDKPSTPPQSAHFITISSPPQSSAATTLASYQDEEEVYEVQRQPKMMKEQRKERFAGVYPPPMTRANARSKQAEQQPLSIPTQVQVKPEPTEMRVPMNSIDQSQTFDPDDDDAIMEDITTQTKNKGPRKPRVAHSSEVSRIVDPHKILERALDAPITLTLKEIIGVSKEVSSLMQDAIRYKRPAAPIQSTVANLAEEGTEVTNPQFLITPPRQGALIRITM